MKPKLNTLSMKMPGRIIYRRNKVTKIVLLSDLLSVSGQVLMKAGTELTSTHQFGSTRYVPPENLPVEVQAEARGRCIVLRKGEYK